MAYDFNKDGYEDIFLNNSKTLSCLEKESDANQCMLNLINEGNSKLTISSIEMSNPVFTYDAGLPLEIGPFSSAAISVLFTPETDDKVETGTMKLNYNQPKQLTVNLTGQGVLPYDLYIINKTMSFKRVFGAHHNIYTGPDFLVKNTADVWLKAGNEINLLPGSDTEYGAKLNVIIDSELLNP